MSDNPEVFLGEIIGSFGVKGWVKIFSHTRPKEEIFKYQNFLSYLSSGEKKELKLLDFAKQNQGLIALFSEIDNRDLALSFKGAKLFISRDNLPKLKDDEVYWVDLIGIEVFNKNSLKIGVVKELFETPKNDVLVVETEDKEEILIPFIRKVYIEKIDLDAKKIIVDWQLDW